MPVEATASKAYTYGIVLIPKFSMLSVAALIDPIRIANVCRGESLYEWKLLSAEGGELSSSDGMGIMTEKICSSHSEQLDSIIVYGGWNAEHYESKELFKWLQGMNRRGVAIGAAEMGSYILARAKLLKGYKATIHWHCSKAIQERYPDTIIEEKLYVVDGKRTTCAGGVACIDMMLHNIGEHHGKALASEVADQTLHSGLRGEGKTQKEVKAQNQQSIPAVLLRANELMESNMEEPLSIPEVAELLGLSQRKLERMFNKHFGCSTVAYYRVLRLQYARTLLTQTEMSVIDICIACGFTSSSYFSKSYHEQFGVRPRDHRMAWPEGEVSPIWPALTTMQENTRTYLAQQKACSAVHSSPV